MPSLILDCAFAFHQSGLFAPNFQNRLCKPLYRLYTRIILPKPMTDSMEFAICKQIYFIIMHFCKNSIYFFKLGKKILDFSWIKFLFTCGKCFRVSMTADQSDHAHSICIWSNNETRLRQLISEVVVYLGNSKKGALFQNRWVDGKIIYFKRSLLQIIAAN